VPVAVHDRQGSEQVSVGSAEGTWLEWREKPKTPNNRSG
jgi:hypothetical protein